MMTKELHDLLQLPLAQRSKLICKKTDRTVNDERYAEALAGLRTALHAFDGLYYPSGDLGFDNGCHHGVCVRESPSRISCIIDR